MSLLRISLIIPFYNVEKHIGSCLESLYRQDIPESDYEVICVDDASPDNSRNVVLEFQKKHINLKLITHSKNRGLGGARNTGIEEANGEYCWFIDSDDMIKSDSLKILLSICEEKDLDVLMFNYDKVATDGTFLENVKVFSESQLMDGYEFSSTVFGSELVYHLGYVWRQIYKRAFLNFKIIRFPENVFWEDTVFMPKSLLLASKVQSVEESFYRYRINPESISGIYNKHFRADLIFQFSFNAGKELLDFSKELDPSVNDYSKILFLRSIWYINEFSKKLIKAPISQISEFYKIIKLEKSFVVLLMPYMSNLNKWIIKNNLLGFIFLVFLKLMTNLKHRIIK